MARLVVIDGVPCAPEEAKISVYDRGFLYGDSVFETVRTYVGRVFSLDLHLARLERSAASLGITMPVSRDVLMREIVAALANAHNEESYARLMITRGSGALGLDPALARTATRVLLIEPLTMPPPETYARGIRALCIPTVRASDAAHSAKIANYLASALALRDARAAGADEALVVDRNGLVIEGTTSNVFAVADGRLLTPSLESGILDGITRELVLERARELGLAIELRALSPAELSASDEVFITSTIRELVPVVVVDGRTVGLGVPGKWTRALHRAFRQHVGAAWVFGED
ncbi:MAG: branched-chain-amino acid aminotransferase [Myxococcales bacterium]|nr:branched-chain-amino acid aminotransferase [Myxococcales bacterium]